MTINFLDFYNHVLPKNDDGSGSEAFKLTRDTSHEKLYEGLSAFPQSWKDAADALYFDMFPETTRALEEWSKAWDLWPRSRTEQEIRDALTAAWQDTGGQSPRYLQDRLRAHGFDVYVHDWWGDVLPKDTARFEFDERCYYINGLFPGTSNFIEGRTGRAFKDVGTELREYSPGVIRDGGTGLLTEPSRTNHVRSPINFTSDDWTTTGSSTVANNTTDPFGGNNAYRWTPSVAGNYEHLNQVTSLASANNTVTLSIWMRGSGTVAIELLNTIDDSTSQTITLTSTWTRYNVTKAFNSTAGSVQPRIASATGNTATSVDIYGAQLEEGDFVTSFIPFADGIIDGTNNAVKSIRYDTRNDDIADDWRFDTDASWYTETLNTATRGRKREFPQVVDIVVVGTNLIIYDATESDHPMWMVFNGGSIFVPFVPSSGTTTSIAMRNGLLAITSGSSGGGLSGAYFILDDLSLNQSGGYGFKRNTWTNIANRNNGGTAWLVNQNTWLGGDAIVNNNVNDVAITRRSGATHDTIAVATNGGVSVINPEGTLAGVNTVVDSNLSAVVGFVCFNSSDDLFYSRAAGSGTRSRVLFVRSGSYNVDGFGLQFGEGSDATQGVYSTGTIPALLTSGDNSSVVKCHDDVFSGTSVGLSIVNEVSGSEDTGMVSYITTDYNTGWMPGDIRGSWINGTETGNLVGGELVTNGTFDSDTTGWTSINGAVLAAVSGELRLTAGTFAFPAATQSISTVVGQEYIISCTARRGATTAGTATLDIQGIPTSGVSTNSTTNVTLIASFVATSTSHVIEVYQSGTPGSGETAFFDNISAKLAVQDRSVKGNDLAVNGTLSRTAIATGAELAAISGFSVSNYLERAYDADFDFGTGDFSMVFPVKSGGNSTIETLISRANSGLTGAAIDVEMQTSGAIRFRITDDGFSTADAVTSSVIDDNSWHWVECKRSGSTLSVSIDSGTPIETTIVNATGSLNNATAVLRVGLRADGANPSITSVISLLRISAYAPSAAQIAKMYADELPMFQPGAQVTLGGTSDAVSSLSFDTKLGAGTGDGVSRFNGLVRDTYYDTANSPLTSDSITSVAAFDDDLLVTSANETALVTQDKTRDDDKVSIPTSVLPTTTDEYSIVARVIYNGKDSNEPYALSFNDGDNTANESGVYINNSNEPTMRVNSGGVNQVDLSSGQAITRGTAFNVAMRNKADDFGISVGGSDAVTDTSGLLPVGVDTLRYGRRALNLELVENGQFNTSDLSWWTVANVTWNNGVVDINTSTFTNLLQRVSLLQNGRRYKLSINVSARTSGTLNVSMNNSIAGFISATGVHEFITVADTDGRIQITTSAFVGSITEISVTEVITDPQPNGAFVIESFEYVPRALTDAELKTASTNGPASCPTVGECEVNVFDTDVRPFVGECGESVAACGEVTVECGNEVIIGIDTYPLIRSPKCVLDDGSGSIFRGECGDPKVLCGAGIQCGDSITPTGFLLVNKISEATTGEATNISCGEPGAECLEPLMLCGQPSGFKFVERQYTIPNDLFKWPEFVYVGGQTWPDKAQVPAERRDEFETTIIKLFPNEKWVGLLVEYT